MELALATGIAPSVWAEEDARTLLTAQLLLKREGDGDGGGTVVLEG